MPIANAINVQNERAKPVARRPARQHKAAARRLEKICNEFPITDPIVDVPKNTIARTWEATTAGAVRANQRGIPLVLKFRFRPSGEAYS